MTQLNRVVWSGRQKTKVWWLTNNQLGCVQLFITRSMVLGSKVHVFDAVADPLLAKLHL